jgi:hypothetical protein
MIADRIKRYGVRVAILLLCLSAWADLRPFAGAAEGLPVAVFDVSASTGAGSAELPAGIEARAHWLLVADGSQRVVGAAEPARLGREATRLGAALREAALQWPGADVLLMTDGRDTDGDALAGARVVAAAGGRVFVAPPARSTADAGLLEARLVAGAPVARLRVRVGASTHGGAELRLSRGGRIVARQTLALYPGMDEAFMLLDEAVPEDGCTYRVTLVADAATPDDDPGNDHLRVPLRPERRVILTWGLGQEAEQLAGDGLVVRRVDASGAGSDPGDLAGADCLVMANLPWRDVGTEAGATIERFVASGGGLLLLGGEDGYAGGGWAGTRFEGRVSPLRVPREDGTGLALVLAVDRSGSTVGATLAHLQEAVRRAVQGIVPGERMGVLPFDRSPAARLLPPGVVGAGDVAPIATLLESLDAMTAGGDTDLAAALEEAVRRVAEIPARERRVLLLTDGDPDHPPDEARLRAIGALATERDVQIGALVVADPGAVRILRASLGLPAEAVQPLDDPQDLPVHLLHWMGAQRSEKARLWRPSRLVPAQAGGGAGEPFEGWRPRRLERLEVATDAGARALVMAVYDDLDLRVPFAAERRVGAGQAIAVAWGPPLEQRRDRADALAHLQPWVARLAAGADRGLIADILGTRLHVRYPQAQGAGGLQARTSAAASDLVEVEPGVFAGPLPTGSDLGLWVRPLNTGPTSDDAGSGRPLRLPALPPVESRGSGLDEIRMGEIAEAGGGRRLAPGEQPPRPARAPGRPLAPWLLLGAALLLLLDRVWSKPLGSATDS